MSLILCFQKQLRRCHIERRAHRDSITLCNKTKLQLHENKMFQLWILNKVFADFPASFVSKPCFCLVLCVGLAVCLSVSVQCMANRPSGGFFWYHLALLGGPWGPGCHVPEAIHTILQMDVEQRIMYYHTLHSPSPPKPRLSQANSLSLPIQMFLSFPP